MYGMRNSFILAMLYGKIFLVHFTSYFEGPLLKFCSMVNIPKKGTFICLQWQFTSSTWDLKSI